MEIVLRQNELLVYTLPSLPFHLKSVGKGSSTPTPWTGSSTVLRERGLGLTVSLHFLLYSAQFREAPRRQYIFLKVGMPFYPELNITNTNIKGHIRLSRPPSLVWNEGDFNITPMPAIGNYFAYLQCHHMSNIHIWMSYGFAVIYIYSCIVFVYLCFGADAVGPLHQWYQARIDKFYPTARLLCRAPQ